MEQIVLFEGSSKRFYMNNDESYLMTFKDDIHGGGMEDLIENTGNLRKQFSYYFYRLLENNGIKTHLYGDDSLNDQGILVKKVKPIKIEVLVRNVARGHWVDSHKIPLFNGGEIFKQPIVEFCLKVKTALQDGRIIDDPRINTDLAIALNDFCIMNSVKGNMIKSKQEGESLIDLALKVNSIYKQFLVNHNWILEDFKFEVGVELSDFDKENRSFIMIDEISPDCSRIRDMQGNSLTKDLFRLKKSKQEIYDGYKKLTDGIINYK